MATYKISNEYISDSNDTDRFDFPKYTTQIINLANSNAGGTRPKVVGQLSELLPEYLKSTYSPSIDGWKEWYNKKYPNAVDDAVEKILAQIDNLKEAMPKIDEAMVRAWAEDLIYNKTFNGLFYQKAILRKIAEIKHTDNWRMAASNEESQNIDGFVDGIPYQIKPDTFDTVLREVGVQTFTCQIIKYRKTSTGIEFDF